MKRFNGIFPPQVGDLVQRWRQYDYGNKALYYALVLKVGHVTDYDTKFFIVPDNMLSYDRAIYYELISRLGE